MREHGPRLRSKKRAIVALYRNPPARGHIVCFDEMGPLQTIPRGGKAWGPSAARRPDRYSRNGTLQWLGALCPTTGLSVGKGSARKTADDCRTFWEQYMFPCWPTGSIHLVLDNLSVHAKALRELPYRLRRRLRLYWLPTNSSWLNLIESHFSVLKHTGLDNTYYRTPDEIDEGLLAATQYLNQNPTSYSWGKI
ncbi:MAG: IS630 family transposase [Planctomycetota bacterium]|nr:IS630 family transposase [Planctomycetota bacterium]